MRSTLRRLFLTLFLRGHSARGLTKSTAPTSVAQKLGLTLFFYFVMGAMALAFIGTNTFVMSAYMHAITFMTIGVFLVACSGETLFNKEEADILLHRPIEPSALLWSKVRVLVEVSLYLSAAVNLAGLIGGVFLPDSGILYPFAHAVSSVEEALFCAGCTVLVYQLCLKWFGRERMENLMTMMQVLVTVGFILGSQILPRVVIRQTMFTSGLHASAAGARPWWLDLVPPGWFAGFDDAVAGSHSGTSWVLALTGLFATALVLWLSFGRLAKTYESGWQTLSESTAVKESTTRRTRSWAKLADRAPLKWWLNGPVEKMSFVLSSAYLMRDREVKLRLYPSLAPIAMFPIIMLLSNPSQHSFAQIDSITIGFGVALSGAMLGNLPQSAQEFLKYSQQWKASEVFRAAPLLGPYPIQRGTQVAAVVCLVCPMLIVLVAMIFILKQQSSLDLLLPGLILVPAYARFPALFSGAVMLSSPSEEAKSANRGFLLVLLLFVAMGISMAAIAAKAMGFLAYMLVVLAVVVAVFCVSADRFLKQKPWKSTE